MQTPIIETDDFVDPNVGIEPKRKLLRFLWVFILVDTVIILPAIFSFGYLYFTNQAVDKLEPTTLTIEAGETVWEISNKLAAAGVVRSELTLFLTLRYLEDPTKIKASTYLFDTPQTTRAIAGILIAGEFDNDLVTLTFVEGMRARDYARIAAQLPNINEADFLVATEGLEGTLFPETYFVPQDIQTNQLVELLQQTHQETLASYSAELANNNLTTEEALILASIIEREANTPESMQTVAGIFLNRLAIGMALQADASIEYVIDAPLGELAPGQLATELRELDSPYNTYLYTGLPPTPIGNPGEEAINAIANPITSDYFYYITGDDGEFYYAETYDQHLINIARHL